MQVNLVPNTMSNGYGFYLLCSTLTAAHAYIIFSGHQLSILRIDSEVKQARCFHM